jgi:predicted RNase H-like nuclease
LGDDVAILDFIADSEPGLVVAIDAPLIVPNLTGSRPCEREVGHLFGRYGASCHPSNRSRPEFAVQPRAARLAATAGWSMDPAVRPAPYLSVCLEVYPHPAMVVLFGLTRIIPYKNKPGRDLEALRASHLKLLDLMQVEFDAVLHLSNSKRWQQLLDGVVAATRKSQLKVIEDEVDGIFCAYLAYLWSEQVETMTVLGDNETGYIVTPRPNIVLSSPGSSFQG